MDKPHNSLPITGIARTITDVMGISAPREAEPPVEILTLCANETFGGKNADRVFIYNPDAIALWLFQKYTALFKDVF